MKNLIRAVILTVLVSASTLTSAQSKKLSKGGVTSDGVFTLETFKFILNNKNQIPRNQWYSVETTGQYINISADLTKYCLDLSPSDIDGLIILEAKDVKPGKYRNNGYDQNGMKVPVQEDYLDILGGYSYFCTKDGVAIAKTNCINEQDYKPLEDPIVLSQPAPDFGTPLMMYVPCLKNHIEMEKNLIDGVGRWSKDHSLYLENNKWYTSNNDGSVSELTCDPIAVNVQPRVVYVRQENVYQEPQQVVYTQSTMGRAYHYQPAPVYQHVQPARVTNISLGFALSLMPGMGRYNYPVYGNQWQNQPQYFQPVISTGAPFDAGNQGYYPYQNSGSFDTGAGGNFSGSGPFSGNGYIPGVFERVGP